MRSLPLVALLWATAAVAQPLPDIPAALEREHTLAVAGVEDLAAAAQRAEGVPAIVEAALRDDGAADAGLRAVVKALWPDAAALPLEPARAALGRLADALAPPESADGAGIDVRRREEWARIGVDPVAGLAVVVDARLTVATEGGASRPLPVLLVGQGNAERLLGHVAARMGGTAQRVAIRGRVEHWRLADRLDLFAGSRETHLALLDPGPTGGRPGVMEAFDAFLAGTGAGLGRDADFRQALDGMGPPPRLYAFATQRFGLLFAPAGMWSAARAAALFAAPGRVGGRLLVSASAGETRPPPAFARFLPANGWVGHAASVDPRWLAPVLAAGDVSAGDVAAVLTGHVAIAGDPATMRLLSARSEGRWLLQFGYTSGEAADRLLDRLQSAIGGRAPLRSAGGRPTRAVRLAGRDAVAARSGPVLLFAADVETLNAAVARAALDRAVGENLVETSSGRALREHAAYTLFGDLLPALQQARIAGGSDPAAARLAAALETLRGPDHLLARVLIEPGALRLDADPLAGAALLGVAARLAGALK